MTPVKKVRYDGVAIAFHWIVAILIIGCFGLALYMDELHFSPQKLQLISWHKWGGITVLWLLCFRLAWRLTHRAPALPETLSALQRKAAISVHHLLYLLMFLAPLSGWMMSSAKGFPVVYLGKWPLPNLIQKNKMLGEQLGEVHEVLTYSLVILALGHALAAIKHHFISKNDVLVRMIPFLKVKK
jgi:cytochrome b561